MRFRTSSVLVVLLLFACRGGGDKKPPAAPTASASAPASLGPKVAVVEGSVILKECPAKLEKRQAEKTLNDIVSGCDKVPGGTATFQATLKPGGAIEISAPDGSEEGTVPICVLKNTRKHKLLLAKPCALAVQIEEKAIRATP